MREMSYDELFDILYGYTIDHVILYNNGKNDTLSKYINSKDDLQRTLDSTNDLFNGGVKFIIGDSDDRSGTSKHVISFIFDIKTKELSCVEPTNHPDYKKIYNAISNKKIKYSTFKQVMRPLDIDWGWNPTKSKFKRIKRFLGFKNENLSQRMPRSVSYEELLEFRKRHKLEPFSAYEMIQILDIKSRFESFEIRASSILIKNSNHHIIINKVDDEWFTILVDYNSFTNKSYIADEFEELKNFLLSIS